MSSQSAVDGFDGACREKGSERLLEVRKTAHAQAVGSPIYRAQREWLLTPLRWHLEVCQTAGEGRIRRHTRSAYFFRRLARNFVRYEAL